MEQGKRHWVLKTENELCDVNCHGRELFPAYKHLPDGNKLGCESFIISSKVPRCKVHHIFDTSAGSPVWNFSI